MPRSLFKTLSSAALLSGLFAFQAVAQDVQTVTSTGEDRSDIRITVYNGNLASVSETRAVSLNKGVNRIEFADVSAQIEPETALIAGGDFQFIEQNFDYDLLEPEKLIQKAVGKTIIVERTNPGSGEVTIEEAEVLSANNGVVLRFKDGIEVFQQGGLPERFRFKEIPENLRAKPTLSTLVRAGRAFSGDVNLGYLTQGFTWSADYVSKLNEEETEVDIQAWITLSNQSGSDFRNVKLQVMAGEINRVPRGRAGQEVMFVTGSRVPRRDMAAEREAISDYHLYTVPHRTDLRNNQTKQVALFAADDVRVSKFYVYNTLYNYSNALGRSEIVGEGFTPVTVGFEIENEKGNNLGFPIPEGVFRLYSSGEGMDSQFLGEDAVPNTPEERKVILESGKAFDITVSEEYPDYQEGREPNPDTGRVETVRIHFKKVTFKNAKEEAARIRYFQHFATNQVWRIEDASQRHEKAAGNFAHWNVTVPAKGTVELRYTMKVW